MKITKNSLLMFGMGLLAGCTLTLSSCSDDDDDNDGAGVAGNGSALVKDAKVLLTSVSNSYNNNDYHEKYSFKYDDKFRVISAREGGEDELFFINYGTGKITMWGDVENLSISFNSKGYITKIQGSYDFNEDGETEKGTINMTYSYDNSGHLVNAEANNELWDEEYYEKTVSKNILTWENGNLTKLEMKENAYDANDGEENYTYIQTFTYGNQPNKYKQYIMAVEEADYAFFTAGLLGVGSEKLPVTEYWVETEENKGSVTYKNENSYNGEFTLNEDGTINTETWINSHGGTDTYKYNYTATDNYEPYTANTRALWNTDKAAGGVKGKLLKNLVKNGPFGHKRMSKKTR